MSRNAWLLRPITRSFAGSKERRRRNEHRFHPVAETILSCLLFIDWNRERVRFRSSGLHVREFGYSRGDRERGYWCSPAGQDSGRLQVRAEQLRWRCSFDV